MVHQLISNFQKLNCLGGFRPPIFNKMMKLVVRHALKVANNLDSAKDKNIPKALLGAGYNKTIINKNYY